MLLEIKELLDWLFLPLINIAGASNLIRSDERLIVFIFPIPTGVVILISYPFSIDKYDLVVAVPTCKSNGLNVGAKIPIVYK